MKKYAMAPAIFFGQTPRGCLTSPQCTRTKLHKIRTMLVSHFQKGSRWFEQLQVHLAGNLMKTQRHCEEGQQWFGLLVCKCRNAQECTKLHFRLEWGDGMSVSFTFLNFLSLGYD